MSEHVTAFRVALLKVLIAIAWVDGELSAPERALLKSWMTEFYLGERQRDYLQFYLDHPTTRQQAETFARELIETTHSEGEREEAMARILQLVRADGQFDEAERSFLERVGELFADAGGLGLLTNRLRGFFSMRPFGPSTSPDRQLAQIETDLLRVWRERDHPADPYSANLRDGSPSQKQRWLLFAAALAGCTWAELRQVLPEASDCIRRSLKLGEDEVRFFSQCLSDPYVRSLDRARLVRGVEDHAPREVALGVVDLLFCLAALDGKISDEETETIRGVALGLKVTHRMFIDRKLRYVR